MQQQSNPKDPPSDVVELPNGVTYNKTQILGKGNYSTVYKGINPRNQESVAVKIVNLVKFHKIKDALENELNILRQLKENPNIIKLIDCFTWHPYIVVITEYCNSGDLRQFLQKNHRIGETQARNHLKQIINALHSLHDIGIMHRDLKPANILLHRNEGNSPFNVKLADFGFSKQISDVENFSNEMVTTIVGTPLYMSPQLLKGDPYTTKSDIWSLGIIYFQMLYGETPWKGSTPSIYLTNIMNNPLLFPDSVDVTDLSKSFIRACLAKDEKTRMGWEELLSTDLRSIISVNPELPRIDTNDTMPKSVKEADFFGRKLSKNSPSALAKKPSRDASPQINLKTKENTDPDIQDARYKLTNLKDKFIAKRRSGQDSQTSGSSTQQSTQHTNQALSEGSINRITKFVSRNMYPSKLNTESDTSHNDSLVGYNIIEGTPFYSKYPSKPKGNEKVRLKNPESLSQLSSIKSPVGKEIPNHIIEPKPIMTGEKLNYRRESIRSITPTPAFSKKNSLTPKNDLDSPTNLWKEKNSSKRFLKSLRSKQHSIESILDSAILNRDMLIKIFGMLDYYELLQVLENYLNTVIAAKIEEFKNSTPIDSSNICNPSKMYLNRLTEAINDLKDHCDVREINGSLSLVELMKIMDDRLRHLSFGSDEYNEINEIRGHLINLKSM